MVKKKNKKFKPFNASVSQTSVDNKHNSSLNTSRDNSVHSEGTSKPNKVLTGNIDSECSVISSTSHQAQVKTTSALDTECKRPGNDLIPKDQQSLCDQVNEIDGNQITQGGSKVVDKLKDLSICVDKVGVQDENVTESFNTDTEKRINNFEEGTRKHEKLTDMSKRTNAPVNSNKSYSQDSEEMFNANEGTMNVSESWDDDSSDFDYKGELSANTSKLLVEDSSNNLTTLGGLNANAEVFVPKKTDETYGTVQPETSVNYNKNLNQHKTHQRSGKGQAFSQTDLDRGLPPNRNKKLDYVDASVTSDNPVKNETSNTYEKSEKPSFAKILDSQRRGNSLGSETNNENENRRHNKSNRENTLQDSVSYSKRSSEGSDKQRDTTSFKKYGDPKVTRQNREFFDRGSDTFDKEYKLFQDERRRKVELDFQIVKEIQQDLFAIPEEYSLAHCVAEDMRMGSGIAVNFRREFKDLDILLSQRQKQGGLAVLEQNDRYIYYLVTKRVSTGKPTYETLWSSLKMMRDHIKKYQVAKLAIPRLGCGLDRLEWSTVKHMIEFLFRDIAVEITVCNFQQTEDSLEKPYTYSCKVVNVKKPVADIEEETSIIYLSSEDGEISTEMEELNRKYPFIAEFKKSRKTLGEVIRYKVPNRLFILNGCIVRKTKNNSFDFKAFVKSVQDINRNCRKEKYYYVAIQAIKDNDDDLINEKIITILRNYLSNVEIYICWDGDLVHQMPLTGRE